MANKTWIKLQETLTFVGGTVPSSQQIGINSGKTAQYQNFTWQNIATQKNVTINGIRVWHNMEFAMSSSEPLKMRQMYFENYSNFKFELYDTDFGSYSLADLLPYKLNYILGDIAAIYDTYPFFELQEPIKVPTSGAIKVTFTPADGLTMAADGVTNPQLPSSGLTNTRAFYIGIAFYGTQERETVADAA